MIRVGAFDVRGGDQARQTGATPGKDVNEKLDGPRIDARAGARGLIVADGFNEQANRRLAGQQAR